MIRWLVRIALGYVVMRIAAEFEGARVQDFVEVLISKQAMDELRRRHALCGPSFADDVTAQDSSPSHGRRSACRTRRFVRR